MSLVRDGGKGTSFNGDRPENSILLAAMSMDPTITPTTPYTTFPDTLTLVPEDHELYSATDSLAWMNTPREIQEIHWLPYIEMALNMA